MLSEIIFLIFTFIMMGFCLFFTIRNKNSDSVALESFFTGAWFALLLSKLISLLAGGL